MPRILPRARNGCLYTWRLCCESLEERALLSVVRLAAWNTLNNPNDAVSDGDFQTVLEALGNETVQGNTKPLDILALSETDSLAGGNSIGRIESILNDLYPTSDYDFMASSADGGGDSTGFVYDSTTVSLLESIEVEGLLTHSILRGKFRPDDTSGDSDFYVYSAHLKSGPTGADQSRRATEAAILRADADALGDGSHVLLVGDFNMKSSFEPAFANLVAAGAGQVQDVADAPGNWFNNPTFKHLHTQDPQSNVDDRFDLQLASSEFYDGVGLEYVDGSYHVFGNDGSHNLNSAITTGSGASSTVLNALASASDHLPVVADYEILVSTPGIRVRETGNGTQAIEGGAYDTYNVVLDTVPTHNVTVTVLPDAQVDVGHGAGVSTSLVFTPASALTPQTVVVSAADDLLHEGHHASPIIHTSASADSEYDALAIADVTIGLVDNDAPTIVINELDADTVGTDRLEFAELYDGGVGHVPLTGKTVVFFNGSGDRSYAAFDLDGFATDASGFFVLGNSAVAGADVTFPNNLLQNGADAVALYEDNATSFPNGTGVTTTNLLDAVVYDTDDADDAGLLVLMDATEPQQNENEQGAKDFQSLARFPDGGTPRRSVTYVAQAPTPGLLNQPAMAGVTITHSASRVDVEEGGASDSYQIALDTFPTSNVAITVNPDLQTDLGAGAGVAVLLLFTPANALIPQIVNVTATDDTSAEGNHTSWITHTAASTDLSYDGIAIGNVVANIVDNETPEIPSIVIGELMYDPDSDESQPGVAEWIELVNTGTGAVDLGGWRFDDEDATGWSAIPSGVVLQPDRAAVFFDEQFTTADQFRNDWMVPAEALIVGISWGSLANSPSATNEVLELLDNAGALMDLVNYDDQGSWPSGSSDGPSIYLTDLALDNNEGSHWARSVNGVDQASSPSGTAFSSRDVGSPGRFPVVIDATPPTVTAVKVGSSFWTAAFKDDVDPDTTGAGTGMGYSLAGPDQLHNLPWFNIDQILVQFSENIGNLTLADLKLEGVNVRNYVSRVTSVDYQPENYLATIELAAPLGPDKLRLTVRNSVTDVAGNRLDGEWIDGVSTISGDGTAGGLFRFRFDVLPGDVLDTNEVTSADEMAVFDHRLNVAGTDTFNPFLDVDGSGVVGDTDVMLVGDAQQTRLPTGLPGGRRLVQRSTLDLATSEETLDPARVDALLKNWWQGQPDVGLADLG